MKKPRVGRRNSGDGVLRKDRQRGRQANAEYGRYTASFYLNPVFRDQPLQSYAWLEMTKGRSKFFQKSILCLGVIGYFVCAHEKALSQRRNDRTGRGHALEL
jgi:hypothetical protein